MSQDPAGELRPRRHTDVMPAHLAALNDADPDDRPVPAAGLGDQDACLALLQATRLMLLASTVEDVVVALGTFVVQVGGRLVPASGDCGSALAMDLSLGTGAPVLAYADPLSVARMRLVQFLPGLVEDARTATSRLRHLQEVQSSSSQHPLTRLLSRREVVRHGAALRPGDVVCLIDIDDFRLVNTTGGHGRGDQVLAALGAFLQSHMRSTDTAGRYGGDELVVLQRRVTEDVAAQRLRSLQALWATTEGVTFSAGVAAVGLGGWTRAIADADAAMYVAKGQGRGRTCGHAEVAA